MLFILVLLLLLLLLLRRLHNSRKQAPEYTRRKKNYTPYAKNNDPNKVRTIYAYFIEFFIVAALYFIQSFSLLLTWSLGMYALYTTPFFTLLWTQLLGWLALIPFVCRFRNRFSFLSIHFNAYCGFFAGFASDRFFDHFSFCWCFFGFMFFCPSWISGHLYDF